jgi:Gene product 88
MSVRNLLTLGNGKLGEGIHAWSLPAVETCPGRSALCEGVCYARAGRFRTRHVQDRLQENLDAALAGDFEQRMVREIQRRGVYTLRVHVSGDFFSPEYAAKWLAIARSRRRTRFYAYTRSWRVGDIRPVLAELAALRNVRLWFSCDADTGVPADVPDGVELAYLQHEPSEVPGGAKLVFRVKRLRKTPATRVGLALVCTTETGLPQAREATCTSCRRCYR